MLNRTDTEVTTLGEYISHLIEVNEYTSYWRAWRADEEKYTDILVHFSKDLYSKNWAIKMFKELFLRIRFLFSDKLTVNQVLAFEKNTFTKGNGKKIKFFKSKGCSCVSCERYGSYFKKEGVIYNLYTADGVLMTQDHIIPSSKGGSNRLFNLQPMCFKCNLKKSNDMPDFFVQIKSESERKNILNRIKKISLLLSNQALSENKKKIVITYIRFILSKNITLLLSEKEIIKFKQIPMNTFIGLIEINSLLLKRI